MKRGFFIYNDQVQGRMATLCYMLPASLTRLLNHIRTLPGYIEPALPKNSMVNAVAPLLYEDTTSPLPDICNRQAPLDAVDSWSLQELYVLLSSSECDYVFIAIDFENVDGIKSDVASYSNSNSQVGLAILDMKDFDSSPSSRLISAFSFVSGSSNYQEKARKKFLFGDSIAITHQNMLKSIQSVIPLDRQIVLVGHHIAHDLQVLNALGFKTPPGTLILDTQRLSATIIHLGSISLCNLLDVLECPFRNLHCGGNDANYTLRALLLLTIRDRDEQSSGRLLKIREIALDTLPEDLKESFHAYANNTKRSSKDIQMAFQKRASKKKEKRLQRSRKHQSRSWSLERQQEIRTERRLRREAVQIEPNGT